MVKNRKNLLDSICKSVGFEKDLDPHAKLPFRLLLEIDTALKSSTLISINEKLSAILKINLEMPMTEKEVLDAINSAKN